MKTRKRRKQERVLMERRVLKLLGRRWVLGGGRATPGVEVGCVAGPEHLCAVRCPQQRWCGLLLLLLLLPAQAQRGAGSFTRSVVRQ